MCQGNNPVPVPLFLSMDKRIIYFLRIPLHAISKYTGICSLHGEHVCSRCKKGAVPQTPIEEMVQLCKALLIPQKLFCVQQQLRDARRIAFCHLQHLERRRNKGAARKLLCRKQRNAVLCRTADIQKIGADADDKIYCIIWRLIHKLYLRCIASLCHKTCKI